MAQRQRGGATLEKRLKAWAITVVTLIPFCFLAGVVGEISGRYIHSGFVVTALLSGVCFLGFYFIVRRQVSIISREKTRDFIYFLAWVILLFSFLELPRCYTILTNDVHDVSSLTQEDVRNYQFFKVDQLDLDTTKVGRFIDHSFKHYRHNTDIEFEGNLVIPIKGLENTFLLVVSSESANYTFGDEKDWEKAENEAASELEENYQQALSLSYYYLEKETDIENGMLYAADATGLVKHKQGSELTFLRICHDDEAPDAWSEVGSLVGVSFAFYVVATLLVFLFAGVQSVQARRKPSGKSMKKIRETLIWLKATYPLVILGVSWIVIYIIELLYGLDSDQPDRELLYRLGALDTVHFYYDPQWWRVLTFGFLHGSIFHLIGNLFTFYIVSIFMLGQIGAWRTVAVFLITSVLSGISVLIFSYGSTVGASGGIFGMIGTCLTIEAICFLEDKPVDMIAVAITGGLCVINLLLSFGHGISMAAHVGGFIAGIVCGVVIMIIERLHPNSILPPDDID
ncbi:MAG: rhomboid family intramembrane serine protease [Prevotella sp.]